MDEEINGILLENEQGKHGFTPSLSLTNPFVRYMQAIRKNLCLLVLLPCAFQILVYLVGQSGVLFIQGSAHMAERNGIGVFAQYYNTYDLIDFILLEKIVVVFVVVSILLIIKRFFTCNYLGTCLVLTPFVVFVFSAIVLHGFDDDLFRELSLVNFRANECRYMDRLSKVSGQYDDCTYTAVEQQFRKKEDLSSKGKLIVWSYGSLNGEIHLVVYDESDEVADPKTRQRYIGYFSDPAIGSYQDKICSSDGDYSNHHYFGFPPHSAMKLKSHFYIVRIGDPNSH